MGIPTHFSKKTIDNSTLDIKKGPDIARALLESLDIPTNFRDEIINNITALDKKELPNKSFAVLQEAHNRART